MDLSNPIYTAPAATKPTVAADDSDSFEEESSRIEGLDDDLVPLKEEELMRKDAQLE